MKRARGELALLAHADPAADGIDHKSVHSGLASDVALCVWPPLRQNCHSWGVVPTTMSPYQTVLMLLV